MLKRRHIVLTCAVLAACQAVPPKSPVPLRLVYEPPNTCRVTVEGRTIVVWPDYKSSVSALKAATTKSRDAMIMADMTVPYKCMGATIIAAQQAGFKHVGFIAEPAPSSP